MIYTCERRLQINAPAEVVWQWMADVRRLLRLNVFHTAVDYPEPAMQAGLEIPVQHNIFGLYRQTRIARIRAYRPYFVAWGELQPTGVDRFPHSQSFTVIPLDRHRCIVVNALRGKLNIPAVRYWFLPVYRRVAPRILEHENRQIAAAVGATITPHAGGNAHRQGTE